MQKTLSKCFCLTALILSLTAEAQTPEQDLRKCMLVEIEKYQPVTSYSEQFQCSVGNKKPGGGVPSSGPNPVSVSYAGYIIIDADSKEDWKISDGGHTSPFISPDRRSVTAALWCRAEDKYYGKSGKYGFSIFGRKQRLATKTEQLQALTACTKTINVFKNEGKL